MYAITAADSPGANEFLLSDAEVHPQETRGVPRDMVWFVVLVNRK
jgi:hypothetical protein